MNGVTVTVGAAAGLVLLFALGAAAGMLAVFILHAGDVGRYETGEGDRPSGWVHDGTLYVSYGPWCPRSDARCPEHPNQCDGVNEACCCADKHQGGAS